jgi:hypothetical protein
LDLGWRTDAGNVGSTENLLKMTFGFLLSHDLDTNPRQRYHNDLVGISLELCYSFRGGFTMSTTLARPSALALVPGPTWNSFEKFRKGGNATLEEIPEHGVGTLVGKGVTYRVLRDADFQHLVGLATDVRRLQQGLNVIIQAAKVVAKHPDQEHVELLIHSAALFAGSPVLPTREGHDAFQLTQEEIDAQAADGFSLENAAIPRPRF